MFRRLVAQNDIILQKNERLLLLIAQQIRGPGERAGVMCLNNERTSMEQIELISVCLGEIRHKMDATGRRGYAVRSLDINYLSERQLMSNKDFKSQCTSWINH